MVSRMASSNGNASQIAPGFFPFSHSADLHYNDRSLDCFSPSDAMPSNRPNLTRPQRTRPHLTLDEQSFQGLLSAAFTIQEHNDRRRLARQSESEVQPESQPETQPQAQPEPQPNRICQHCGALNPPGGSRCESCGLDEFRPGERMQRNWASMWLMSQEQGLWPERSPEVGEAATKIGGGAEKTGEGRKRAGIATRKIGETAPKDTALAQFLDQAATDTHAAQSKWKAKETEDVAAAESSGLALPTFRVSGSDESSTLEAISIDPISGDPISDETISGEPMFDPSIDTNGETDSETSTLLQRLAGSRVKLRFRRADIYLGTAIFVAVLALLWPAAGSPRHAALGPWERALVSLGIAEVPTPAVHLQGDPSVEVWVDPHSALYYCSGEEQYGKTAGGRLSTQHDAQIDRFEPANRSACE
jgi:ribosomal protein L40E